MKHLKYIVAIIFCSVFNYGYSLTLTSAVSSGEWDEASSWSPSAVPGCGDTIIIQAGQTITVSSVLDYSGCAAPMFVEVYGTLQFVGGGSKLRLPSSSGVDINSGGSIQAPGGGGGSSRTLEIGSTVVWSKGDGPVSGPMSYGSPLPVELMGFSAVFNDGVVSIYWSTATESNSDYFLIQRTADGTIWEDVIRTEAAGFSSSLIEYSETDNHPLEGKSFYRLVQFDRNGESKAYNVVPVQEVEKGEIAFEIFPNPTMQDNINLNFKGLEGKELLVVLRDISGKEFFSKVEVITADSEIIVYTPDVNIPKGVYLVTASSADQIYSQKIIIQ